MILKLLQKWAFPSNYTKNPGPIYDSTKNGVSRILLSYYTQTSSSAKPDTLYSRISPVGHPKVSIVPILDQWVQEGNPVDQVQLRTLVKQLRKHKRYGHALQLSEWMSHGGFLLLTPGDVAVRLDLICRVHGLEEAEKYFTNVPASLINIKVYGALLCCHAYKRLLQKAEATFQKMRELGYVDDLSYNVMLGLYCKSGKYNEFEKLLQEMQEKGITCGRDTYCIRMNACTGNSDIEGMEKLLQKMENDHQVTMDWNIYVVAVKGYLKAGMVDKGLELLKKAEKYVRGTGKLYAYQIILSMYASLGEKSEVYRMWSLMKNKGTLNNSGYFHMISSLVRLDDISGAEEILQDWESAYRAYDFRIPNILINAYTKKRLYHKAEAIVSGSIKSGKVPPASTWDCLATGYSKDNQMEKAVETMKKAVSADQGSWRLNRHTITACIEYLKRNGDVEQAEGFQTYLKGDLPRKEETPKGQEGGKEEREEEEEKNEVILC